MSHFSHGVPNPSFVAISENSNSHLAGTVPQATSKIQNSRHQTTQHFQPAIFLTVFDTRRSAMWYLCMNFVCMLTITHG